MNRPTGPGPDAVSSPRELLRSFAEHVENLSTVIIDRISGPRDTGGPAVRHDDEARATTTSGRPCGQFFALPCRPETGRLQRAAAVHPCLR
ncbi:hypothetical protein ACFVYE_02280 [Streptomyces sp. NPDC058239]|uniref:hypothetical protein n=1 Tax=unclassified Streptomyces TaxID=2593676 RepID=UPI00365D2087